jgi:Domain of unknown function (DUF4262)
VSGLLDPQEQKVVDDIQEFGCSIMHVFDAEGELPEFSYSIGYPVSVSQPEVIVFGVKRELRHSMINELQCQCADGLKLADGLRVSNLVEGWDCVARHVMSMEAIQEHFGWALWYHETQLGEPMREAYQIVWPGALQGLFPWQAGCDPLVIESQPALYAGALQ